ncbi:MAG TPA: hypothetical protein VNO20_09025 [Solirubrobacterales bacterium]|nr:hypothetical protein [Solirubrobacterales bacterium]
MSDLRIPIGRYARRVFWAVILSSIGLIILVRFLLIPKIFGTNTPSVAELLNQSLGDIFSTIVAATVLSGVVLWLIAPSKKRVDLEVIHPKDIGVILDRALRDARSWHYSGSTGRWNRSKVLPALASAARRTNSTRSCRMIILDPENERICTAYANYRRGLRTGRGNDWDLRSVRADLCATIVLAALHKSREPLLDIRLFVKAQSPVFRVDASGEHLVLTREDPAEPALACGAGTHFFDAFMESVNFDARQARELEISEQVPGDKKLDRDIVRQVLDTAALQLHELASDNFVDQILEKAVSPKNPYGF